MSKHTPGPWSVAETRHGYDTVIRGPKSEPIALALIGGYSKKEGGANSLLIAAAPELLEACQMLLTLIRRNAPELSGKVCGYADAAIAKATGEQP